MIGQKTLIVSAVAAIAFAGGGYLKGRADGAAVEKARTVKTIEQVRQAAATVIDAKLAEIKTLEVEKAQAQGEVAKVNAAILVQLEEQKALLLADQDARTAAAARTEKAAQDAARNALAARQRAQDAMEVIRNVADQCARAGVPDDVLRVLDTIVAPPAAGVRDR